MDTGINAIIKVYAREELQKTANEVTSKLEENIKNELQEGKHSPWDGYEHGQLMDSIHANIETITDTYAIIGGTYAGAPQGEYVLRGIRGKVEGNKIDFLGDGLEKTIEMYGGTMV